MNLKALNNLYWGNTMNNDQVNFKVLWKILPKVLVFLFSSVLLFALFNFFFGLFGVFLFQEPIQKIIFYSILIFSFILYTVKEYDNFLKQMSLAKRKLTINIYWSKEHRRYNVNIPELNVSIFANDLPEAFAKAESLIQSESNT